MPVRGRTVALSLTLAAVLLGAVDAHAQTAATGGFSSCPPAGCSALPPVEVPLAGAAIAPDNRTAGAPAGAPPEVVKAVAAANRIAGKPYKWGVGHGRWRDVGYDCSGTVSYVLHAAGLLDAARDSSGLMSYGERGGGNWITVYAHGGHAYMVIAGLRFDTSGRGEEGPRWRPDPRGGGGFVQRHPAGF